MKRIEIAEILMPGDLEIQELQEEHVRSRFGDKVRRFAARIPFVEDLVTAYYCALDPETPPKVRGLLLAALAYFVVPVDTIPDFLAGFGLTDDITVLTAAFTIVNAHMKDHHRMAARIFLSEGSDSQA